MSEPKVLLPGEPPTAGLPTWVPVYVERAIYDLIPESPHARESARVAWMWDDLHPGYENELCKWQNEAIRQRRDLIALTERMRELGDRIEAEEGSYWPPRDNTPEPPTLEVSKLAQRWINELREYVTKHRDTTATFLATLKNQSGDYAYAHRAIIAECNLMLAAHETEAAYAKEVMLHAVTKHELNKYRDEKAHFAQFEDEPTNVRGPERT